MSEFLNQMKVKIHQRLNYLQDSPQLIPNTLNFCDIFKQEKPAIIAEIKRASPSEGQIYQGPLSVEEIALQYVASGAGALSILTEPDYFLGSITYLKAIRAILPHTPLLQKDFIMSELQINEALAYGASAILLIVAFLDQNTLKRLYHYAEQWGLTVIVEVHTQEELARALSLNPKVIGINNRNLNTLEVDLATSRILKPSIPSSIYTVCESGIQTFSVIEEMTALGFNGFLMGTHFMRSPQPGEALRILLETKNGQG